MLEVYPSIIQYVKYIREILPGYILALRFYDDVIEITTNARCIFLLLKVLKLHLGFNYKVLVDIAAVDLVSRNNRFVLNYILLSLYYSHRIIVKVYANDLQALQSVAAVYSGANWMEREVWDMFGIIFCNHPDLRRLHTDYGFVGFPLRKDFPLTGFYEIYYDEKVKRIVNQKVILAQEYRYYNFNNPWVL